MKLMGFRIQIWAYRALNMITLLDILSDDPGTPRQTFSKFMDFTKPAIVATTLAARIRLYSKSIHGLLYDKPVVLTVPVW